MALTCDRAVQAARDALPGNQLAITRVQFLYGSVRPLTGLRLDGRPPGSDGYVVFTYMDGSRQSVDVILSDGSIEVGSPASY